MMARRIRLGTRKSLLAVTQSTLILEQLERLNPGLAVEMVGIETQGDRITHVPLSQIEGKEFFVKEIDEALLRGEVDFTVHSYKDLSIERPAGIVKGAIPERFNPRDIVVFHQRALERLSEGLPLRIGTSSPRRLENGPPFLANALPRLHTSLPQTEFVEIRGNVNTRLSRLHEVDGSGRCLDGVVLAFAGLARLMRLEHSAAELTPLLSETKFMVLPLDYCPAAPAQGALAIECRADDQDTRKILATVHDAPTERRVNAERALMAEWGGGCHQKFGITAVDLPGAGLVLHHRGRKADDSRVEGILWQAPDRPEGAMRPWDGFDYRSKSEPLPQAPPGLAEVVFVASPKAVSSEAVGKALAGKRVWVSGTSSWFKLAAQGIWVEGCCEGYGFDFAQPTFQDPLLALPPIEDWSVLTHSGGVGTWQKPKASATYQVKYEPGREAVDTLKQATHCFWTSSSQFESFKQHVPSGARHGVGPGKTKDLLEQAGIAVQVFPSHESWLKWVGKKGDL